MRLTRTYALALLCLLGPSLLACGDDGDGDNGDDSIPCDIRNAECRRTIFRLTARVRGQKGATLPPSRIISREQFANETRADLASTMSGREGQILTESLRLLHLLPSTSSLDEAMAESSINGVAAYYESTTQAVTIIADAAEDPSEGSFTLSHEYVHSLQDQRDGLALLSSSARSTDEAMAISALFEGEATVLSDVAMSEAARLPYERDAALGFLERVLVNVLKAVETSPAPFNEGLLVLPYPVGGRPIAEAYLLKGAAGVQAFYRKRPSSLTGWIEPARADLLPGALRCTQPDAPEGYEFELVDRLGATGLIGLFVTLGLSGVEAFETARSWSNDSFVIFGSTESELAAALAWRIGLRDEAAARELESKLSASVLGFTAQRTGAEVVLTATTHPAVLSAWTTRNECTKQKSRAPTRPLIPVIRRYLHGLASAAP